mgnify:CR=1 FL=1
MVDWQASDISYVYTQYELNGYFVLNRTEGVSNPEFPNTQFEDFGQAFEEFLRGIGDQNKYPNEFKSISFVIYDKKDQKKS